MSLSRETAVDEGAEFFKAVPADFPSLSVANVTVFMGPAAERFAHYVDTMRKAGLSEE